VRGSADGQVALGHDEFGPVPKRRVGTLAFRSGRGSRDAIPPTACLEATPVVIRSDPATIAAALLLVVACFLYLGMMGSISDLGSTDPAGRGMGIA
jgi:hypothetical protein